MARTPGYEGHIAWAETMPYRLSFCTPRYLASAIMALLVWNSKQSRQSFLRSGLVCLAGDPNATMAGHLMQISASLPGTKQCRLYNYNYKSAVSTARPVSWTKRTGLQGSSSASSIRALADLAVLADC
jgi:hypothetical protein